MTLERITPSAPETFCPVCGLESVRCASEQSNSWEGNNSCHTSRMLRLPLLDVEPIAQSRRHPNDPDHFAPAEDGPFRWSIREILMSTDPTLTSAVRCIIAQLKLSCFPEAESEKNTSFSISGAGVLGPHGSATTPMVDDVIIRSNLISASGSLGSCAVLALAVREFARCMVDAAVTAFSDDRARVRGSSRAVLSPAHVSRGVAGSFLTRGVLGELPSSPVAVALATLAQQRKRDPSPSSVIMDTSCKEPVSAVHSLSHCMSGSVEG